MGEAGEVNDGLLLIDDEGKVEYVGPYDEGKVPEGVETLDFGGKTILPGLVDAHTHVGIHEEGEGWEGQDTNEMTGPVTPQVRGLDGINPAGLGLRDAARAGVTTVNTGPGSGNVVGGQFVGIKTAGSLVMDDLVIREPTAMKMATGENPKRVYKEKDRIPSTRIGTAATLRKALFEARDYWKRKESGGEEEGDFKKDFKMEALVPVVKGELKAKIHAHRADDIITAIRIAEEFGLDYSIDHCTEGHKIADFLAEKEAEAVVGPSLTARSKRETVERTFQTPGILSEEGIKVAITSDSPVVPIQYLPLLAAFAVREGMDEERALRAITVDSAEIAGVGDRVGSLEKGKDADFLVTGGSIFDLKNNVERVFIEGSELELASLGKSGKRRTF
ncbi:MAG: amidohydrolase [Candidatus Acetothermia bacterium]